MAKKAPLAEGGPNDGSPYPAGPSTEKSPASSTKIVKPTILFQTAGGMEIFKRKLQPSQSFESVLASAVEKLDPRWTPKQFRISHVRSDDREVDLIDEYDYASFQRRALDNPSARYTIKIYLPGNDPAPTTSTITPPVALDHRPESPMSAGPSTYDANLFETPKRKPTKDKKGKRKAEEAGAVEMEEQNSVNQIRKSDTSDAEIPTSLNQSGTPSSAIPKSAKKKKKKQKNKDSLPGPAQSPTTSSSFNAPAPSDSAQASLTPSTLSKGSTRRKRKRDSILPDAALAAPPKSDELAIASESEKVDRMRTSKSPEKKRQRKSKTPHPPTIRPPPAFQINLSSATSSAPSPYTHLNKYRPVTPSPLGRLATPSTPSVDGDAEENLSEQPEPLVLPLKERKKLSKKGKTQIPNSDHDEVVDDIEQESLQTATHGNETTAELHAQTGKGKQTKKARTPKPKAKLPQDAQEAPDSGLNEETPARSGIVATEEGPLASEQDKKVVKKTKAKKAKDTVVSDIPVDESDHTVTPAKKASKKAGPPVEEVVSQTPDIPSSDGDTPPNGEADVASSSRKPTKKRLNKDVSAAAVVAVQPAEASTNLSEDESTPITKSTKASKAKTVTRRRKDSEAEAFADQAHAENFLMDHTAMEADREDSDMPTQASPEATDSAVSKPDTGTPHAVVSRFISLSHPYIYHVRPNDPKPFITSRYNSSSLDSRSNQKIYGQSKSAIVSVEHDESSKAGDTSLEEEEVAPSPAEKAAESRSSSKPTSIRSDLSTMDTSKITQHLTPDYQKQLQQRGQCVICNGPSHLQKDCPEVLQGLDRLRELLEERKAQRKSALRNTSIEHIQNWIDRLDRIASQVKGHKSNIKSHKPVPLDLPDNPARGSVPTPARAKEKTIAEATSPVASEVIIPESVEQEDTEVTAVATTSTSPLMDTVPVEESSTAETPYPSKSSTEGSSSSLALDAVPPSARAQSTPPDSAEPSVASQSPTSDPSVSPEPTDMTTQQTVQSPARDHSAPPIYLKALASKAGSVSGLSVSDAVIETGSSASESEDEEDESGSGSESESEDGSDDDTPSRNSRSRSSGSVSRSPSPTFVKHTDSLDPPSLDAFMSMPLSQKLRRRARQSAAGMQDVEMAEEIEEESDTESTPERQLPAASFAARGRAGSESSVGEFADEKSDEDYDMDEDEVMPFTQMHDLAAVGEDAQTESIENTTLPEAISNQPSKSPAHPAIEPSSRRSFADLAGGTSPSPIIAEFPGSIALQEAIDEDAAADRITGADELAETSDARRRHENPQGLMSPPSSPGGDVQDNLPEPMPATQLINGDNSQMELTPQPVKGRVTRGLAKASTLAPPVELASSASQPVPFSPPRRRHTRSMSREPTAEPPSPRVTTRRVSSSQPNPSSRFRSKSPSSNVPVRRSARGTTPSSQIDELMSSPLPHPRRSSRRGTTPLNSSQMDQLQSSPPNAVKTPAPIPEEDESEAEDIQVATQQTPNGSKAPLVPETQESEPRRIGLRSSTSNLFMSPGSQLPQTQAYNIYPNLPSSETGVSVDETPKALGMPNGVAESPLSARKANGSSRKSSLRFTSPVLEEQEEERTDQVKDSQPHQEDESDIELGHEPKTQANGQGTRGVVDRVSENGSESSSDESDDIPPPIIGKSTLRSSKSTSSLYPALPLPKFASSQPAPITNGHIHHAHTIPTLSSLSKDVLRNRSSFGFPSSQPNLSTRAQSRMSLPAQSSLNGNGLGRSRSSYGLSHSQPAPAAQSDSSSGSGTDSDSSEEEKTPANMKNRISRGAAAKPKVRRRASQGDVLGAGW
ncbi:uncharacterized protein I303_101208 [Kwoniella dejecticola CBS 10117]|uniref:Uncharacterized protein n=1 Tax=Kwoniella dejecticola CBS 10117 TaxID=1296121 RepID=A0A1A6AH36_9TREE|nr:uncharacterized protein I303_01214 [Kwoniella dejecticola CBS 10117]OBR89387.1 hypothetical protein I303_01214 [Kwoniella dejecticola CBS 10117]